VGPLVSVSTPDGPPSLATVANTSAFDVCEPTVRVTTADWVMSSQFLTVDFMAPLFIVMAPAAMAECPEVDVETLPAVSVYENPAVSVMLPWLTLTERLAPTVTVCPAPTVRPRSFDVLILRSTQSIWIVLHALIVIDPLGDSVVMVSAAVSKMSLFLPLQSTRRIFSAP
jgi:hypothetical protein